MRNRAGHSGQFANLVKLAKFLSGKRVLNGRFKNFRSYRVLKPACQTRRELREPEYLQSRFTGAGGRKPAHLKRKRPVNDGSAPKCSVQFRSTLVSIVMIGSEAIERLSVQTAS
jgi:hypothetical protein